MIPCEYICTPIRAGAGKRASHPETIAEFRPRAEAALSFVDQPFLVGDHCTIADIGC
jgi:glutathione S-transferase